MILLGIEAFSVSMLCIGIVLYRFVISGHRSFVLSLQHTERQERKEKIGFLAWFYIVFTLAISATVIVTLSQSPLFLS